ncbi:tyrosine-type recombinase/integrase [Aliiroseovarius sp. KMU-71]|uniref:tyrosine-type recombinase/integrase n=1 Tax=Aliiroseovarius sp. KMU-71 TaxID=3453123 RepID=UPI003F44D872
MPSDTSDFQRRIASLVATEQGAGAEPRTLTAALMQAALDTGIRKELRSTVAHALEQATGDAPKELTDLACRRLKPGNRLTDPQFAGLALVASKRGKRWIYRSQASGKQRQVTLGHYPAMTLLEAREKWVTVRAEGLHSKVSDKRSQTTLETLADAYADAQNTKGLKSWRRTRRIIGKNLLSRHATMTLGEVTREVLEDCYTHLIDSQPGAAHNIRMAISGMFTWADETRRLPNGLTIGTLRKTPKSNIKEYVPPTAHLQLMLRGLDDLRRVDADILRFQCLTGTRISEALGADWSEIDLIERRWTIPANRMKAKRPHIVMLSQQAMELLEQRDGRKGRVFEKRDRKTVSMNWAKRRDELGLPTDFTSHVLRKALLTWVAEKGGGRDIRDRLSAHSQGKSADAHYQLSELNAPAAEWWQRWADHLDVVEAGGNVEVIDEVRA